MSQTVSDSEFQRHLDQYYPFIEQGALAPGRWVGGRWQGQLGWRVRHGQSVVLWSAGKISSVQSALYPDGTRGDISSSLDHGFRRRSAGPARWVYGSIDVQTNDVIFADAASQPTYTPPAITDVPNLEADLARDVAFLAALKDDRFASAVYMVLRNRTFYKHGDDRAWSSGDRQVARLVSGMRALGESYQDYFPHSDIAGTWPDDRIERESALRKNVAEASQPVQPSQFDEIWPHVKDTAALGQSPEEQEAAKQAIRARLEAARPAFERERAAMVANQERFRLLAEAALVSFLKNENADVFDALHEHITRIGWRSQTVQDRERVEASRMKLRIQLLRDLKALATRSEGATPDWARQLEIGKWTSFAIIASNRTPMTAEEREVRRPNALRDMLTTLARKGQISKQEFDDLEVRLGN